VARGDPWPARAHGDESGAIRRRRKAPSVAHRVKSASNVRGENAERGAIRGKQTKPSVEQGVIPDRCDRKA